MTSFDYLRNGPSLREVLSAYRLPSYLGAPIRALLYSVVFAGVVWGGETVRLQRAVQDENIRARVYAEHVRALNQAKIYERHVKALTDLDSRVRSIAGSGTATARRLAEIARVLPRDVWLTAITPDGTGLSIDGRTQGLSGLSNTLLHFAADPVVGQPTLTGTEIAQDTIGPLGLRFSLQLASLKP